MVPISLPVREGCADDMTILYPELLFRANYFSRQSRQRCIGGFLLGDIITDGYVLKVYDTNINKRRYPI
jgi:hypothetical protein